MRAVDNNGGVWYQVHMPREAQMWCKMAEAKRFLRALRPIVLAAGVAAPAELGYLGVPKLPGRSIRVVLLNYVPRHGLVDWLHRAQNLVQSDPAVVATMQALGGRKLDYRTLPDSVALALRALPDSLALALKAALALLLAVLVLTPLVPLPLLLLALAEAEAAQPVRLEPERSPPRPPPLILTPTIWQNAPNTL